MRKLVSILLILFVSVSVLAQNETIEEANKLFKKKAYLEAATLYKESGLTSKTVLEKLGDCYFYNNHMASASEVYGQLFKQYKAEEIDPLYLERYAETLKATQKYSMYDELMKKSSGSDEAIKQVLANLDENLKYTFKTEVLKYDLEGSNFGANYFGEDKIIFATTSNKERPIYSWNNKPYLDLMVATSKDGALSDFELLPDAINSKTHEASAVLSRDGEVLYFSRTGKKKVKDGDIKHTNVSIYKSVKVDGKWSKPEILPFCSDDYSTQHPTLSADGTKMYFSSNMPGSIGSFDIYEVTIKSDGYGKPNNLGPTINTEGREQFPFISSNGTLYFASNGYVGFGGLDLYYASSENGVFNSPVNLGETINSGLDDFAMVIDEETNRGYFSSDRSDEDTMYTLIREEKELGKLIVKGQVKDLFTGKLVPGTVVSILRDKQIPVASQIVGIDGFYNLTVPDYNTYTVKAAHNDYNVQERELVIDETFKGDEFDILLEPVNEEVDFKGENYARGTVKSNETGEPLLGTLVSLYDEKGGLLDSKVVDEMGRYTFDIEPNKNYVLTAHNDQHDVYEKSFSVNDSDNKVFSYDIFMLKSTVKPEEVQQYTIPNINFDFDKSNIRPDAAVILDKVIAYMMENEKVSIEIAGHADAYGFNEYNILLSQRRATATAKYLINRGIDRSRINTSYFGEKLPLNGCIKEDICTPEEYAINRRCEFTPVQ